MKEIKRFGILLLALIISLMSACAKEQQSPIETADHSALNVYATFYPLYAIADMIAEGSDIQLHCLAQPQDGCLRDYTLSDWDLALLTGDADAVIAGGCGLESFESLLYALGENGPVISAILYEMDLIDCAAVNTSEDTDSHWLDANPHVYMRVSSAMQLAERVAATFIMLDAENEALYEKNLELAQQKLENQLNQQLQTMKDARKRRVIVMNEALAYVADEYDLKVELYYARENGEPLEGNDLTSCLEELRKSDSRIVLLEKQAPQSTVAALRDAGFIVALMDTMSTRRADEGSDGYFAAQNENLQALLDAFMQAATCL